MPESTRSPAEVLEAGADLPAPRLQLRWERRTEPHDFDWDGERSWNCHYELVLPLREFDIRREIYEDGEEVGEQSQLVVPIKGPTIRGANGCTPCVDRDGELYFDSPIRDGAHAQWDAEVLGNLPVFVIAPDGTALRQASIRGGEAS